jgi:hypothetical protein
MSQGASVTACTTAPSQRTSELSREEIHYPFGP